MSLSLNISALRRLSIFTFFFLITIPLYAQLSDLHYLPPLKQSSNGIGIVKQAIYLSTPVTTPFTVKVYRGTNTTPVGSFSLSKTAPYVYALGDNDNNITLVDNANTGLVISNSGLRFESENGEKFYVNYRGAQAAQGSSLTSKGRSALGKKFRWGGGPVIGGQDINATLGIMATEDGTKVEITGYDPSIAFRQGNSVTAITDNTISITLNKGQSFVLEYFIGTPAVRNDKWLGASVVSDKNIVVSLGNALYSSATGGGRDIAIDQIIPENVLGSEYVFVRGYGDDNLEFPIIIATQNGTEIYVNDSLTPIATIDAGKYYTVPGSYYSGVSGTVRKGENMYVRTSKQVYAFQSTAGANNPANVDYNFIAPINFLLEKVVDYIPSIEKVANATIQGGISIISAASTPDSDVAVLVNGVSQSLTGKRKAITGTDLWVTYFLDGLSGDVSVSSTNSIAVGFTGQSGVIGVSGYFSGFETIPSIDISVAVVGNCLQDNNVTLTAPIGYAIYQWYLEGKPVAGGTQRILVPTLPGTYTVGVTSTAEGKEYVSAPVDVSDCLPEIKIDVTSNNQIISVGESINLRVNYKFQSFFSSSNAEVDLTIPSNFEVTASTTSTGSWSGATKKWTLGNLSPGNEEILELTLKAVSIGNPVTVSATNSQTVYGSDNVTLLNEGGKLADDLSEVFNIKNATVINASTSISKTVLDSDFSLSATSNNPNALTYASSNEGVAKVDINGNVDIVSAGVTTITISQTATDSYGPGSKSITLTVSKVNPELSEFSAINKTYGNPNFLLIKPVSNGDGAFSYSSSNTSVATVNSATGEITVKQSGTTTISATQAATANYNSSSITATLTVIKANQNITVGTLPDAKTILELVGPGGLGTPIAISATSSSSDQVTISLPAGSIGTLSGTHGNYSLDNVSGSGTLTINFDVSASLNYNAASASVSLDVSKKPQNIVFSPAMPATVVYSDNVAVPITASSPSSANMVYAISSGPATISNGELLITGTGTVNYSVNNLGDNIYTEAPEVTKSLNVSQGTTVLSNFSISDKTYGTSSFSIPVPTSNRTGSFTYTSSASNIASVSGSNIVINTPGSVTITANQPSTENWTASSISTTFQVLKADPILSGIASISKTTIDSDFSYSVSSTAPANPIVFRSSDLSVATVNSSTGLVSIKGIGNTVITASQASTSNYNAASTTLTLTVTKANPTLGTVSNINKLPGDANFTINSPSSSSGGAFTYTSSNTSVVNVNSNTGEVSIVGEGSSTITITQATTATYNSASTSLTVTVSKLTPTLGSVSNLDKTNGDADFMIAAPSSNSNGVFTYSSSNTNIATVNNNTGEVSIIGVGSSTITINQAETVNYNAASTTFILTVSANIPTQIAINSADNQTAVAGSSVITAPSVIVKDVNGNPVSGVDVTFSVSSGGGIVAPATAVTTDASGIAALSSWTLGTTAGSNTILATSGNLTGSPLTFTATGIAGPATRYLLSSSSSSAQGGTSVTITTQLADANGNAVSTSGKTVTWSSTNGGSFSTATSTTDADGKASVSFKLSGTNAIVHTVKVTDNTSLTGESASITVNKGAGVKYVLTNSVNTIVAGLSLTLTAQLVDDNDLPVSTSGKVVTWTKDSANGSFASSTSTTDASGKATVVFTTHTLAGTTHTITATDDENLKGIGATITTIAGDGTKYVINADNSSPVAGEIVIVSVQLVDASNNNVNTAGKTVTWTKSDDNSVLPVSQTNSNGIATFIFTSNKVAGQSVVVTAKDVETQKEYSTTITTKAGPASKYLVSSETDKPVAGSVITIDAQLVDANNNPVKTAGTTINWSKTDANGSFATSSSLTNANGLANVKFTTHTVAATQTTITATDSNNLKGSSGTITTQTGTASKFLFSVSNFSPIAGTNVTITAQLVDANNNPVNEAGKSITWSKSDANGSFASPVSLTNASGLATIEFTSHTVVNTSTSITASTAEGIKSSSDIIKTIAAAPKDLTYTSPVVLIAGETMQNLIPSVTGIATEYSINPNTLVRGLNFNQVTGIISGKPLAESVQKTFVVTAKNNTGSTSFSLNLSVMPAPTPEVKILNNQTFQLKDDIISMELETEDSNGNPSQIIQDKTRKDVTRNYLILENSLTVKVLGSGFLPGSDVVVEMFSNPQLLGIVPVDANGSFSASLKVSPDTEIGTHTIRLTGMDITEVERKLAIGLIFNMEKPTASIITGYTAEIGKVSIDFIDTDKRPDLFTSRQYSLDNGLSWNFFPDGSISSPLILKNLSEKEINKIIIRVANSIGFSDASNEIAVFIGDNDGDLVPDYVEARENSDATNPKSYRDSDKDGVPDYVEELDGTNANNAADFKDTDKGGVPDYVESILYKFYDLMISDPMLASDDSRDTDGDGVSDYHEILAGTNPKDGPANLSYSGSSVKVLKGNSLKLLPTFSKGKPNQYSISPALPEGLSIDPNTGIISGTLTANISGTITYTIKASNAFGTVETQLTIIYNSVPTDIILSNNVIEENNAADALIGTLTTIDPDTGDAHTYSLPAGLSADNQFFKIEGSSLVASKVFDYEKQKSYSITVRTTDMSGAVLDKIFNIKVLDANEPPTKIILSASGMYENNTIGSLVANLSTEDLDLNDIHTYSIVNGDMSSFSLNGNRLISNEKYDYARKNSYTVRIRTEDKSGLYHEQDLTIAIHKAPVIFGTGNETGTKIRTAPNTNPMISKGFTSDLSVNGEDIIRYEWTAASTLNSTNISNPIAKPLVNTTYQLKVSNKSGATAVVYISIEVIDDFNITPNNILSPDGDGINDLWKVENIENYPDNEVMIFDKAGRVIFRQKGYADTWDGRLNESVLTEGVYYYIIKPGQGSLVKKGYINLINRVLN